MARDILLVKSGGPALLPDWQAQFARHMPQLDVRGWDDPAVDPAAVAYVLVWRPEAGRLAGYPNLRAIFSSAAGVDHIVGDPALPAGVPVFRMVVEETAQTVAEYVCLQALAWLRDYDRMVRAQADRRWDAFEAPRAAAQTRVGIMGLGIIGRHCAGMLQPLGFPVHGWARNPKPDDAIPCRAGDAALRDFLAETDLLVALVPDTPQTRGLLCAETLRWLPRGAALINVARGPLVVPGDLIAALDDGHLSAAILDVFETEPLDPADPLWGHPQVKVTAHVAGFASRAARARKVAEMIATLQAGGMPAGRYDAGIGY